MVEENFGIIDNGLYNDYAYLDGVIKATLKHENCEEAIFSIIFVSDEEIHQINREYRNVDRVTDVISFALEDEKNNYSEVRVLGDIYVSIPQMKRQAMAFGHSEKRELSFLVVHGLLHLLGYDHMNEEEEKEMFALQELILDGEDIRR